MIRRRTIPLADAASLAHARRRSLVVRTLGAGILVALAVWLALDTRRSHDVTAPAQARTSTVVVLDISGSIGALAAATIVRTLDDVARQGGHAGLVLFSDDAEEALPPAAPATLLRGYASLFRATNQDTQLANPWEATLSAGTQISRGLDAARAALERAGISQARVVLVSDLADSTADEPRLRRELLAYARDPGLSLRVAAVPEYDRASASLFRRVLGSDALAIGRPPAGAVSVAGAGGGRGFPFLPVALALATALVLAGFELANAPLAWREAHA